MVIRGGGCRFLVSAGRRALRPRNANCDFARSFASTRDDRIPALQSDGNRTIATDPPQIATDPPQIATDPPQIAKDLPQISELEELNNAIDSPMAEDKRLRALELEYEYLKFTGEPVPKVVTDNMKQMLLNEHSSSRRKNLWAHFRSNEERKEARIGLMSRRAAHRMKVIENLTRERLKDEYRGAIYDDTGVSVIGPPHVTSRPLTKKEVFHLQNCNMEYAHNFGQSLVLDMHLSSDSTDHREIRDLREIIATLYKVNRTHPEPFNIHLCNFDKSSLAHQPFEDEPYSKNLWNVSSRCFTALFPKERLLYLSPTAKTGWTDYKHDDVIVLGAYGTRGSKYSNGWAEQARVKELGLRTARLNTADYFVNRSLPNFHLQTMIQIVLDARDTDGDWLYAFRNLGGKASPVDWRPKYHFMKSRVEAAAAADDRTPEERCIDSTFDYYVHERTIFKSDSRRLFEGCCDERLERLERLDKKGNTETSTKKYKNRDENRGGSTSIRHKYDRSVFVPR